MAFLIRSLMLLLASSFSLADGSSHAVNERLSVSKAEMEAHWRVDCASSWAKTVEQREQSGAQGCVLPLILQRQLQLCSFIYQPPGEQVVYAGPDFHSALAQKGTQGHCEKAR